MSFDDLFKTATGHPGGPYDYQRPTAEGNQQAGGTGVPPTTGWRQSPPTSTEPPSALPAAEQSLVTDLVADGLSIQDKFRPEPLYRQTGEGHYASETVKEIQEAQASMSGLESQSEAAHGSGHELAGRGRPLAQATAGDEDPTPLGEDSPGRGGEYGFRRGASGPGMAGETPSADPATQLIGTTESVLGHTELAARLAERAQHGRRSNCPRSSAMSAKSPPA